MGGCQSASLLNQSGGAGVPAWLVLHSRSIISSREDQERQCPISGAPSPPQIAARLWVRAHRARGATQASTSAGPGVVKAWENHRREPESCQILGKCSPGRLEEATVVPVSVTRPKAAKRPLAGGESMDTTDFGAISPTLVQDCNRASTQFLLSPRSQQLDALQPPPSPVLADIAAQLLVFMASVQSLRLLSDSSGARCSPCRQRSRR